MHKFKESIEFNEADSMYPKKEDELFRSSSLTHPLHAEFPLDLKQNWHPSHLVQGNSFLFSSLEKWML